MQLPSPPSIRLSVPYARFVETLTPDYYEVDSMQYYSTSEQAFMIRAAKTETQIIAPNTSLINFSDIPKYSLTSSFFPKGKATPKIPKTFNWHTTIKAPVLSPVLNQYACGSCWAFSITSCLSDQFVIQNLLIQNPQANVTELMSCWKDQLNNQCGGSTPALALSYIETHGIARSSSIQGAYSWCSNDEHCNGKIRSETSTEMLNRLIPSCTTDFLHEASLYVHSIRASPLTASSSLTEETISSSIMRVKEFILSKGPVVGNYNVYDNFYSSNFLCGGNNPDNIYLDLVDYSNSKGQRKASIQSFQFMGGHSVVIVGWSEGKVLGDLLGPSFDPHTWYTVPYWIVRNSWGTSWGLGGFFHMAMYPFNRSSQFDVTVEIQYPVYDEKSNQTISMTIPTGGILLFEISLTPVETFEESATTPSCVNESSSSSPMYVVIGFIGLAILVLLCFLIGMYVMQQFNLVRVLTSKPCRRPYTD